MALEDTDCRVTYPLTLAARLYRIEHLADARDLTPDGALDRLDLRQGCSVPPGDSIAGRRRSRCQTRLETRKS